jgi:hypothetical protein
MTGALSIALATLTGLAIVLGLDPRARGSRLIALAFPFGISACALALGILSAIGVPWSRASVLTATGVLLVPAAAAAIVRVRGAEGSEPSGGRTSVAAWLVIATVGVLVLGHAIYASLAPPGEWDFWAIWGLKGRVFHEAAAIDWAWLERPANAFAHPDYPLLVPLAFDFVAALARSWPERELGLLFSAFAGSVLLFVGAHLREQSASPLLAAVGGLALAGPVLNLPAGLGLADLPLLVFGSVALLELRSGLVDGRSERFPVAAAALACAAMTKNEGIALVVAAAAAILVTGGARRWCRLAVVVPAGLAAAGWIALRSVHGLGTDLFLGDAVARAAGAAGSLPVVLRALMENPPRYPLFWICAALAIAVAGPRRLMRERFLLVAVGLQLAFFLAAYLVTPHDVVWHIASSWPRLLGQLVVPIAFVALSFATEPLGRLSRGVITGGSSN